MGSCFYISQWYPHVQPSAQQHKPLAARQKGLRRKRPLSVSKSPFQGDLPENTRGGLGAHQHSAVPAGSGQRFKRMPGSTSASQQSRNPRDLRTLTGTLSCKLPSPALERVLECCQYSSIMCQNLPIFKPRI